MGLRKVDYLSELKGEVAKDSAEKRSSYWMFWHDLSNEVVNEMVQSEDLQEE